MALRRAANRLSRTAIAEMLDESRLARLSEGFHAGSGRGDSTRDVRQAALTCETSLGAVEVRALRPEQVTTFLSGPIDVKLGLSGALVGPVVTSPSARLAM